MKVMRNRRRWDKRTDDRALRDVFKEEISRVRVPLPPSPDGVLDKKADFGARVKHVSAALVTAAAIGLLIVTAGNRTPLSGAVDKALTGIDLRSEITGFVIETGKIYRSEYYGGSKQ